MKAKIWYWITIVASFFCYDTFYGLEKRKEIEPLTVSLIIPCHSRHFNRLQTLLQAYCRQTVLPDEVVISISGVNSSLNNRIQALEQDSLKTLPFILKILKNKSELDASANRNLASEISSGNLLIYQDADDLPHLQRIQILKHIFENYKIDFLIHSFTHEYHELKKYNFIDASEYCTLIRDRSDNTCNILAKGCPAMTKKVFEKVKWEPANEQVAEDSLFNSNCFEQFENSVILSLPIYLYRPGW